MRRLSGNLFFCHLAFLNYCELFFFNGQTFIILGEGRGYYDMGHVLLLFLTKITSFRHIPSTEKCVETDYNIYYSDSKDRDRLESYFRSNSILRLAVLFPKPQYKNASHLEIQSARFTELLSWECSLRLRFEATGW